MRPGTTQRRFGVLDDVLGAALGGEPDPEVSHAWERLARRCGSYDQSHLNRDFRTLAGRHPGRAEPAGAGVGPLRRVHDDQGARFGLRQPPAG